MDDVNHYNTPEGVREVGEDRVGQDPYDGVSWFSYHLRKVNGFVRQQIFIKVIDRWFAPSEIVLMLDTHREGWWTDFVLS